MRTRSITLTGMIMAALGCRADFTSPSPPTARLTTDKMVVTPYLADSAILVVAGDMHANCLNHAKATAAIVKRYPQALIIPMGDNAGQHGTRAEYQGCYAQSWGEFKSRTYATIGNHELNQDPTATGHYDYFNGVGVDSGRAGHRDRGYYTLNYGGWRIFVANSHQNIDDQTAWLTRQLATSPKLCTMAIWHRPFFTSSAQPANVQQSGWIRPWWTVLYNAKAELILNGHVHSYERLAEMRPDGVVDRGRGIREFVVGTGGTNTLFDFNAVPRAGSQKRIKTWGVLKLTLWPTRYKWQFINVAGLVLDQGQATCH